MREWRWNKQRKTINNSRTQHKRWWEMKEQ